MTEDEFQTQFAEGGFLSAAMPEAITAIRAHNEPWFELASRCNSALQRSIVRATGVVRGTSLDPKVISTLIAMRCAGHIQAALLLAERGMTTESDTLFRNCIEGSLCLAALHDNPTEFIRLFKADDEASRKALAKFLLENDFASEGGGSTTRQHLEEAVVRGQKTRNLQLADLAGMGSYKRLYLFYRSLSHGSAHVSAQSLKKHLQIGSGSWNGFRWGPADNPEIVETLALGILVMNGLGVAFTQIVQDELGNADFARLSADHKTLTDQANGSA